MSDNRTRVLTYYLVFLSMGLSAGLLGPTLLGLANQTNSTIGEIGFIFTVHSLGYLIGSTVFGRFFDRFPGHRLLCAAILVLSAALVLISFSKTLFVLLGAALVLGTAEGVGQVGVNTLLVWLYRDRSTPLLNGAHFFFGVGALTSPLIVAYTVKYGFDFNLAYLTVAAMILPVSAIAFLTSSPAINGRSDAEDRAPFNVGFVALVALFYFLYLGAEISFGGWIPTYSTSLGIGDEVRSAYLASGFWSALTLGRLAGVAVSFRLRPEYIIGGGLVLAIVGFLVLELADRTFSNTYAATVLIGLSFSSIYPTMFSLAGRRFEISGKIAGLFVTGGSVGAMTIPFLVGLAVERYGARVLIGFDQGLVVAALAVLVIIVAAYRKTRTD